MFRFFKKLRFRLAKKSKFAKYLKYAVGEIVLVVVGILIALQVNDWSEQNKTATSIDNNLAVLKQNLREDQRQLQNLRQEMITNMQAADSTLMQIKTIIPVSDRIKTYLITLIREFQFSPNTNAVETMTQSNEIPSLSPELRTAILDYYALTERAKEREHISNSNIQNDYQHYVLSQYPHIIQRDNRESFIATYYQDDPRPISPIEAQDFLQDAKIEALTLVRYYQVVNLKEIYEGLIHSANDILTLIEEKRH
ncbi:hypothetical protein GGR28_003505 [Lewinella aquimaris]|uniref:Uncharacterized protein n=1 Tax=Neolewinella aquimaris TaxID=1835722 RepID=A0A840EJ02_9BACT|nr:DUF6090 family protein [Neolewinella aquimaris]MBB4080866.1 hypothetical protein [Neolewinella aquimaris]